MGQNNLLEPSKIPKVKTVNFNLDNKSKENFDK